MLNAMKHTQGSLLLSFFHNIKPIFLFLSIMILNSGTCFAGDFDLSAALVDAKSACSGISDAMSDLKTKAGINTAVTSVGTVASGVALGTGIAKSGVDAEYQRLAEKIQRLIAEKSNVSIERLEIANEREFQARISAIVSGENSDLSQDVKKMSELEAKSKSLGNVRTGTLAVSTLTGAAGTALAVTNKIDEDLESKVKRCVSATKDLSRAKLAAKLEGSAADAEIALADKIINACRDWEFIDLSPINKRANASAISSGVGVGTGLVGTITSGLANKDATRNGDAQKEKSLNSMSNVMAGASVAASATATMFNITQISAIKKAVAVADECEEALK